MFHHFGPGWNISTTTGWITMKFSTNIHVPLMMYPNNFGDRLTFHLKYCKLYPLRPPRQWQTAVVTVCVLSFTSEETWSQQWWMTAPSSRLSIGCSWSLLCKRRVETPLHSRRPSWSPRTGRVCFRPHTPEALLSLPVEKRRAVLKEINILICASKTWSSLDLLRLPRRHPGSSPDDRHKTCYQWSCFHNNPCVDTHRRLRGSPEPLWGSETCTTTLREEMLLKPNAVWLIKVCKIHVIRGRKELITFT